MNTQLFVSNKHIGKWTSLFRLEVRKRRTQVRLPENRLLHILRRFARNAYLQYLIGHLLFQTFLRTLHNGLRRKLF